MQLKRRTVLAAPLAAAVPATAGKLRTRTSKQIEASAISVGFETLDRRMFDPERTYPHLARLGVKWARCQTGWARTETARGEFDFAWLDSVVDSLLNIGIRPWFNLGYGNRLYSPRAEHETAVGWAPIHTPEQKEAWVRYVSKLADRYGDRVKHWEIWNEPNHYKFWLPNDPNPDEYMELVKLTAPAVRKRVPDVTLIGGSHAGMGKLDYIERCFELGLGDFCEKFAYHPYRPKPEGGYREDLRGLRGVIARYAPKMAVWQGENGAPSEPGGAGALSEQRWNEERQAKWLLRRLLTDLAMDVELTSYFHTVDLGNYLDGSGQTGKTNRKGLLRGEDYTPKKAYFALQNLCTLFDSDTRRADLLIRAGDGNWTATFIRKSRPVYVYWNPANLHAEYSPRKTSVAVWSGKAAKLERPVLVDLLRGAFASLTDSDRQGGYWYFKGAPVNDYPLVITDAEVVS